VYSENTFSFEQYRHLAHFLDSRKQVQQEAIHTVEVNPVWLGLLPYPGELSTYLLGIKYVLSKFKIFPNLRKLFVAQTLPDRLLSRIAAAKVLVAERDAGDIEVVFVCC
jgi:hypothetical protein